MIILGIDPGLATTGFGVIKKTNKLLKHIDHGTVCTKPNIPQEQRLKKIYLEINKLINKHKPDLLVIEKIYFFKNLKTAIPVSEAKGVIMLAASQKKVKLKEFTPLQVKMIVCGYGRATKQQVQKMVKEILKLDKIPRPDDASDALAIALCITRLDKGSL